MSDDKSVWLEALLWIEEGYARVILCSNVVVSSVVDSWSMIMRDK